MSDLGWQIVSIVATLLGVLAGGLGYEWWRARRDKKGGQP